MPDRSKIYQRLPGRSTSTTERHRVYAASDHVLFVTTSGFSERYRRFYYRDIQAIVVRQTNSGRTANVILGILLGLTALLWLQPLSDVTARGPEYVITYTIINAVFGVPLLINILLGPTCHCYIKTAVQTERLNAVGRLGTAQKFLQAIRPRIAQAQAPAAESPPAGASPEPPGAAP